MEPITISHLAQGLGVFLGAAGVTVYGLKKNGKIHFGTPKERRTCARTCIEHNGFAKEVRNNTKATEKLSKKVDAMSKDLNTAVGFIKAKTGGYL
jgi:hypothetical protein